MRISVFEDVVLFLLDFLVQLIAGIFIGQFLPDPDHLPVDIRLGNDVVVNLSDDAVHYFCRFGLCLQT